MNERPPRAPRAEPREIAELKQLKIDQPELASPSTCRSSSSTCSAASRRACRCPGFSRNRSGSPRSSGRAARSCGSRTSRSSGRDFRLTLRQTADILHRFEAIERAEHQHVEVLARDGNALRAARDRVVHRHVRRERRVATRGQSTRPRRTSIRCWCSSIRPFLARCAEVLGQRIDFSAWHHGHCPFCGWEPDFAVITPSAERRLICGRCSAQWAFPALACPFCANDDRSRITSFATRDGRYRVSACDVCKRYLKAYDAPERDAAGHGRGRRHCHAAARRGRDAARLHAQAEAIPAG